MSLAAVGGVVLAERMAAALCGLAQSLGEPLVDRGLGLVECNPVLVCERGATAVDVSIRIPVGAWDRVVAGSLGFEESGASHE